MSEFNGFREHEKTQHANCRQKDKITYFCTVNLTVGQCHQSSDLHTKQHPLAAGFKAYYPDEHSEFISYDEQRCSNFFPLLLLLLLLWSCCWLERLQRTTYVINQLKTMYIIILLTVNISRLPCFFLFSFASFLISAMARSSSS